MTRDVGRDGPPDDDPVVLWDKFVTPAEAVVWLDPSMYAPGQGTPVQFGDLSVRERLPDGRRPG